MVSQVYPLELQFLDLHLPISNDIGSTKIYDKHDDRQFPIFSLVYGLDF